MIDYMHLDFIIIIHIFDKKKEIEILDFLTGFVIKTKMLNMSEAQECKALPTIFPDRAKTQFHSKQSEAYQQGGVT